MDPGTPVGPNLMDSGAMSKPSVNSQPFNNARLMQQNELQNRQTGVPQAQTKNLSAVRVKTAEMNDAQYKAEEFKNREVANFMYANDMGNATFQLGIPEVAQKTHQHVIEQGAIARGQNPQIAFTSNRLPV